MKKRMLEDFGFAAAVTAMVAILVYQPPTLNTSHAVAVNPPQQVLDRTIYIEADEERQALGYDGYTLSPHEGGYRIEVLGRDRHEGTILVCTDHDTYSSFTITRDDDTRSIRFEKLTSDWVNVYIDGEPSIVVTVDDEGDLVDGLLVPFVSESAAIDVLNAVLSDGNFRDETSEYTLAFLPLLIPVIKWGLPIVVTIIIGGTIIHKNHEAKCTTYKAECQKECWASEAEYCKAWQEQCGGKIDGTLVQICREKKELCEMSPHVGPLRRVGCEQLCVHPVLLYP